MCFRFDHFLHDAQEVDGREEVAPGEVGDGVGRGGGWVEGEWVWGRQRGVLVYGVVVLGDWWGACFVGGGVRIGIGRVERGWECRVLVAEVEVGHFFAVGFGRDHCDGVLLVEELEDEGEIVGVEEELS